MFESILEELYNIKLSLLEESSLNNIEIRKKRVKNNKPHIEKKDIVVSLLKKYKPEDYKREAILKKARKKAHTEVADKKRNISNEVRELLGYKN